MEDLIVIGVLVLLVAVSAVHVLHNGKSGCCSGGGYRFKKKKLSRVLYTKTFRVEGMHCKHCCRRVEETVGDIPALAGHADLKKETLTVQYAKEVPDAVIAARLSRAGYTLR